jgi:hypothetical protein
MNKNKNIYYKLSTLLSTHSPLLKCFRDAQTPTAIKQFFHHHVQMNKLKRMHRKLEWRTKVLGIIKANVVAPHHDDADRDPNFHFILMAIQIRILTPRFIIILSI